MTLYLDELQPYAVYRIIHTPNIIKCNYCDYDIDKPLETMCTCGFQAKSFNKHMIYLETFVYLDKTDRRREYLVFRDINSDNELEISRHDIGAIYSIQEINNDN